MINPKNKRVQVTLPGETVELLKSLSIRYNKSFSETVKWAINVLASKRKHNIVIKLSEQNEESTREEPYKGMSEERFNEIRNKLEPPEDEDSLTQEEIDALFEKFKDR